MTACDGWELGDDQDSVEPGRPYRLTVVDTETCPLPAHLDPKNVLIQSYRVRLVGGYDRGVPANYFYASLLCTDGTRYLADFEGCAPLLSGPPVGKGQVAEGYLNFPVPPGKTPETIVYAPELLGSPGQTVTELSVLAQLAGDGPPPGSPPP